MRIVCGCEGSLYLMADKRTLVCGDCRKTYPGKEVETILKCMAVANYEPSGEGQRPPTDAERRAALKKAALRALRVGVRFTDSEPVARPAPEPMPEPAYRPYAAAPPVGVRVTTTGSTTTTNTAFRQRIVIHTPAGTFIYDI